MPITTDRQITATEARFIASGWHDGQSSALYAFASSGHLSGSAELETWVAFRDVTSRAAAYAPTSIRGTEDRAARRDLAALGRYLRANVYSDIMVCDDCYSVHHFGDIGEGTMVFGLYDRETGRQSIALAELRNAEVLAAYDALGGDQYVTDNTDSNTGDGIDTFSWSRCQCCGSTLGGSRSRLQIEAH